MKDSRSRLAFIAAPRDPAPREPSPARYVYMNTDFDVHGGRKSL